MRYFVSVNLAIGLGAGGLWAADPPKTPGITPAGLLRHIERLASDEFEGRAPASHGEELTVQYLVDQFQNAGLQPGGVRGSWIQEVPIVGVKSDVQFRLDVEALSFPQDFVAWSPFLDPKIEVTGSGVVFVGYGVTAPEYSWDDFKGADVRGKTLLILVGDPPIPDPKDASKLDESMFKGRAMTYYGRWTYKFEEAARRGAAAAVIIHETKPAAYPWFVVVNSWGRERFDLEGSEGPRVKIASWISLERAEKLLASRGHTYAGMKEAALRRDFKPIDLGVTAQFTATQTIRSVKSHNVLGKLEGRHPQRRNEWLIYNAHWDHLGRNASADGDQIFNGAIDNATGTAGLLELARAFGSAPVRPRRSVLFLAVTAEEQGLLGAKYYAAHPVYPLNRAVAVINMDELNPWGPTRDIRVIGWGQSTLDSIAVATAKRSGRVTLPETHPERGSYYRSDHFEFAKVGVPALYFGWGEEFLGPSADERRQQLEAYIDRDYHKPSDEVKPYWDLTGAVADLELLFRIGWEVAEQRRWPEWSKGSEFRAARQK